MAVIAYTTNTDSDDISVVDLNERREVDRITIGGSPRGSVRIDANSMVGYVSNTAGETISIIDLNENMEVGRIQVGPAPRGLVLSPDGATAYVSNSGDNSLSVVDLEQRRELHRVPMGKNPRHMALARDSSRLLVAQWGSDSIVTLDVGTEARSPRHVETASVGTDARPYSVTLRSDGTEAFVANTQATYVSVFDPSSGQETGRVEVGYGGRAVALFDDDKYGLVSVENANSVVVFDTETKREIGRTEVGPSPRGVAVSKTLGRGVTVMFTRSKSAFGDIARNSVALIDLSNPAIPEVLSHIRVGLGPCSVAILDRG